MGESYYLKDDEAGIEESAVIAAQKNYAAGNYENALKIYNDLLSMSVDAKLYFETAMCYYKLKRDDEAIEHYKKSLSLGLKSPLVYSYLGNIYYRKNDLTNAIQYWHLSRYRGPEDESVCLNLAIAYFSKKMYFEAITYYENYLKYATDKDSKTYKEINHNMNNYFTQANDYNIKGEKAEFAGDVVAARNCYLYAVKKYPVMFNPNFNLGKLYFEAGNIVNALVFLKQAYKINRDNKQLLLMLGDCYEASKEYSYSYCFYKRFLNKSISNQSEYLVGSRRISKVSMLLTDAMKEAHAKKAEEYKNNSDYYAALEEYENCVLLDSNDEVKYIDLINDMKLHIDPETPLIKSYMEKGSDMKKQNNFKEANRYYTKVMKLSNPQSQEYKLAKSGLSNV